MHNPYVCERYILSTYCFMCIAGNSNDDFKTNFKTHTQTRVEKKKF